MLSFYNVWALTRWWLSHLHGVFVCIVLVSQKWYVIEALGSKLTNIQSVMITWQYSHVAMLTSCAAPSVFALV